MQVLLSALGNFPWSLSVLVMAITAMIIFREPIAVLISRSHELRAGRFFSLKAKPIDPKLIEDALRKQEKLRPSYGSNWTRAAWSSAMSRGVRASLLRHCHPKSPFWRCSIRRASRGRRSWPVRL
jgi:hypothetical protein